MPTYFIRLPEGGEERQNLDLLLNGLEKIYEVITFNVIGVVADDARVKPILADLAMELCKGTKAVFLTEKKMIAPIIPIPEPGNGKVKVEKSHLKNSQ